MIKDTDQKTAYRLSMGDFVYNNPKTYIPSPKTIDYEVGFIDRYFVSKINDNTIIETSGRDYNLVNSKYFNKAVINWQIRGLEKNKYDGKILVEYGVGEYNRLQIAKVIKNAPNIEKVLTNYFQFWLGY